MSGGVPFTSYLKAQQVAYDAGVDDGRNKATVCCGYIGSCSQACVRRADWWQDIALSCAKVSNSTIVTPDGKCFRASGDA